VLENYSISELYKVLMVPHNNIMSNLSPEEYRICRKRIIESILATDMAFHQKNLSTIKTKMETFDIKKGRNIDKMMSPDNVSRNFENQQMLLNLTLHAVDISSPGKQFTVCNNWMQRVYDEFFSQGDLEKQNGLAVSLLCDRNTVNPIKSQIGFMTFVVGPTFETMADFFPETSQFVDNITQNVKKYQNMLAEEEKLKNSNK
jgi:cAMP-specific phosphodiesterase 4